MASSYQGATLTSLVGNSPYPWNVSDTFDSLNISDFQGVNEMLDGGNIVSMIHLSFPPGCPIDIGQESTPFCTLTQGTNPIYPGIPITKSLRT